MPGLYVQHTACQDFLESGRSFRSLKRRNAAVAARASERANLLLQFARLRGVSEPRAITLSYIIFIERVNNHNNTVREEKGKMCAHALLFLGKNSRAT